MSSDQIQLREWQQISELFMMSNHKSLVVTSQTICRAPANRLPLDEIHYDITMQIASFEGRIFVCKQKPFVCSRIVFVWKLMV